MDPRDAQWQRYRIWIAGYDDWQPTDWQDVPPRAIAVESAEPFALSAAQAKSFLEGFNSEILRGQMLHGAKRLWAVAVPVVVRFDGEPRPGDTVTGHRF